MMLRTTNDQPTLWEAILPEEALRLPTELERVDALLDDAAFFAPFTAHFDPIMGRPSIPIETYLRMMFLKHRYDLGGGGAAPDHAAQAHHALRRRHRRAAQRDAAGQGSSAGNN